MTPGPPKPKRNWWKIVLWSYAGLNLTFMVFTLGIMWGHREIKPAKNPPPQVQPIEEVKTEPPKPLPATYQKRFCDEPKDVKPEGLSLIVPLAEGCYQGPIFLEGWHAWEVDKSQKEGDWASMWCDGRTKPEKIHPFYEDFQTEFKECGKFYLQGKGKVHFTKLR